VLTNKNSIRYKIVIFHLETILTTIPSHLLLNNTAKTTFFILTPPSTPLSVSEFIHIFHYYKIVFVCLLFFPSHDDDDDDVDSWYKDGIPLMSDGGVSHQPGLWGGKISSTQVKLNITQDMNGVKIACQGTNEALQRSINEAIELQVLCKLLCEKLIKCAEMKVLMSK
jgi:hypothetical protein